MAPLTVHCSLLTGWPRVCKCDAGPPRRMVRRASAAASLADWCSKLLEMTSTAVGEATGSRVVRPWVGGMRLYTAWSHMWTPRTGGTRVQSRCTCTRTFVNLTCANTHNAVTPVKMSKTYRSAGRAATSALNPHRSHGTSAYKKSTSKAKSQPCQLRLIGCFVKSTCSQSPG